MRFLRSLFGVMLVLSMAVHAGVAVYFESGSNSVPRPIAPERGKWSISLQASIESAAGEMPKLRVAEVASHAPIPDSTRQVIATEVAKTEPVRAEPTTEDAVPIAQPPLPTTDKNLPTAAPIPTAAIMKQKIEKQHERTPPLVQPEIYEHLEKTPSAQHTPREQTGTVASDPSVGSKASKGTETDDPPRTRVNPTPAYPADALRAGHQGLVILRATVEPDGKVSSVRVHRSSGFPSLDQSAADTTRKWQFHPGRRRGVATTMEVEVPVRFVIRDRS